MNTMVKLFEHIIMKRRLNFTFQNFSCLWFTGNANHCLKVIKFKSVYQENRWKIYVRLVRSFESLLMGLSMGVKARL